MDMLNSSSVARKFIVRIYQESNNVLSKINSKYNKIKYIVMSMAVPVGATLFKEGYVI